LTAAARSAKPVPAESSALRDATHLTTRRPGVPGHHLGDTIGSVRLAGAVVRHREATMTHATESLLSAVDRVVGDVIAPAAISVDAEARFPAASIAALAECGALGVLSATDVGGLGLDLGTAVAVVDRVARACGSTAMVLTMHLCATAVLEKHAPHDVRRDAATGRKLGTLAFSESGSRSHFWAPTSTARRDGDLVVLDASKSWVTSAHHAATFVWSSRPMAAEGASTLWLVREGAEGLAVSAGFDGLGLRGNDSCPMRATGVKVSASAMLGNDGGGFDVMMGVVLPHFQLLSSACSLGLMEAAIARSITHATTTKLEHLGQTLADNPITRNHIARMRILADSARGIVDGAVTAIAGGAADAGLRVLQSKAHAADVATQVLDIAMQVCGGAAFRKETGVERYFRDARASTVMAPTTDVLRDFIGRAVCGMPLA
jgi:alkylation response protein AidB-like acyl-CoA dehydrogenase